jgi:sulfonate transport system permease protein
MTAQNTSPPRRRDLRPLALPLALLLAWWIGGALHAIDPRKLPPIPVVASALVELVAQDRVFAALGGSVLRGAAGFGFALALGLVSGALLGLSRWADRVCGPTLHALRQVAPFAWLPLIGAAFGGGEASKVAFIAVTAYPFIAVNTCEGVRALSKEHVELARVLEIDRLRFFSHVVAPSAAPQVLAGAQLGLIAAWLAVIGAEYFLEVAPGIGSILTQGRASGRMELVLLGIFLTGAVGLLLSLGVTAVERALLRWRPPR